MNCTIMQSCVHFALPIVLQAMDVWCVNFAKCLIKILVASVQFRD